VKIQAVVKMSVARNRFYEKKWQLQKAVLNIQKSKSELQYRNKISSCVS